jgi:hypothetical protein
MVKSLFIFLCICILSACSYDNIPNVAEVSINKDIIIEEPELRKCDQVFYLSESFVGTKEIGSNSSFNSVAYERMLKNAGWKRGQAYCSYSVKGVLDSCNIDNTITGWSPTSYNKKDVIYTEGNFIQQPDGTDVMVMSLSYSKYKNDRSRYKAIGHTGIIKEVNKYSVTTYEGNTDSDGTREGNGFYMKIRPLNNNLHITRWYEE